MVKLIVNADDFGMTCGINKGIIKAYEEGIVNSTTIMMNGFAVDEAMEYAKKNPSLGLGIHLVLTFGKPLSDDVSSLIDKNGDFYKHKHFRNSTTLNLNEIEKEWDAQIQRFLSYDLFPTHIDSHHHIHSTPLLIDVVKNLSLKYDLPVRVISTSKIEGITPFSDLFFYDFYEKGVTMDYFEKFQSYGDDAIIEVMTHPGEVDDVLRSCSSYVEFREQELEVLLHTKLPVGVELLEFHKKV